MPRTAPPSRFRAAMARRQGRLMLWNLLFLTWGGAALSAVLCLPPVHDWQLTEGTHRALNSTEFEGTDETPGQPDFSVYQPQFAPVESLMVPIGTSHAVSAETWFNLGGEPEPARPRSEAAAQPGRASTTVVAPTVESPGRDEPEPAPVDLRQDSAAIRWILDHQHSEGYICPRDFARDTKRVTAAITGNLPQSGVRLPDTGSADARIEATAFALLVLAENGSDHKDGQWAPLARSLLRWLIKQQREDGAFGLGVNVRQQAIAVMALAEIYGLSGDMLLKPRVEAAVEYLLQGRSARGGWAEEYRGNTPDCISTTIAVLALKYAMMSGFEPDITAAFAGASEFMDRLVTGSPGARAVRYTEFETRPRGPNGAVLTHNLPICEAAYIVATVMMRGLLRDSAPITETAKELAAFLQRPENLPVWSVDSIDSVYWWFATEAAAQVGGQVWKLWHPAVREVLLESQRGFSMSESELGGSHDNTDEFGSWDAVDAWSGRYGRVGSTALASFIAAINYRYERLRSVHLPADSEASPRETDE